MTSLILLAALIFPQEDLEVLLRRLGDESAAVREDAAAKILERWRDWKDGDLEKLRAAADHADREVGTRTAEVLRRIGLRRKYGPPLGRFKDLDRIIVSGLPEERRPVLFETRRLWRLAEIDTPLAQDLAADMVRHGFEPGDAEDDLMKDLIHPFRSLLKPWLRRPETRVAAIERAGPELTPDIIPLLKDADPRVRAEAARTLARRDHPVSTEEVLPLLREEDAKVRAAAADALGRLKSRDSVAALVPLLKDPSEHVRKNAVRSLGALDAKETLKGVAALLEDPDVYVRSAAVQRLVDWKAGEYAGKILSLMTETWGYERTELADHLRTLGLQPLRDRILLYVTSPDSALRAVAWELVGDLGPEYAEKPVELLKHQDGEVRSSAAWALIDRHRKEDARTFLALLKDPDPGVRGTALSWFRTHGSKEHVADVAALLEDRNAGVRWEAAETLGAMGARDQTPRIARLLKDKDETVVSLALRSLGWLGAREYTGDMIALLDSGSQQVRDGAIRALGDLGAREAIKPIAASRKDERPAFRDAALEVLGILDPEGQVETLLKLVEDEDADGWIVYKALMSLEWSGSEKALRRIEGLLTGNHRFRAAQALLSGGGPERLDKVLPLLADSDPDIRRWMVEAIAQWSSRGIPPSDPARLARILDRVEEADGDAYAVRIARVGLGLREPATLKDLADSRQQEILLVLCLAHARETFPRLYRPFTLEKDVESAKDLESAIRDQAGVRLEVSGDYHFMGCVRRGTKTTGMRLIDRLNQRHPVRRACIPYTGFVIEGDRVRVVLEAEAHAFWLKKLGKP